MADSLAITDLFAQFSRNQGGMVRGLCSGGKSSIRWNANLNITRESLTETDINYIKRCRRSLVPSSREKEITPVFGNAT
jgi:hypothetical protein